MSDENTIKMHLEAQDTIAAKHEQFLLGRCSLNGFNHTVYNCRKDMYAIPDCPCEWGKSLE